MTVGEISRSTGRVDRIRRGVVPPHARTSSPMSRQTTSRRTVAVLGCAAAYLYRRDGAIETEPAAADRELVERA